MNNNGKNNNNVLALINKKHVARQHIYTKYLREP